MVGSVEDRRLDFGPPIPPRFMRRWANGIIGVNSTAIIYKESCQVSRIPEEVLAADAEDAEGSGDRSMNPRAVRRGLEFADLPGPAAGSGKTGGILK